MDREALEALPGYRDLALLHEGAKTSLYRGVREADGLPVVLKLLRSAHPTPHEIARLRHEHDIVSSIDSDRIVRVLGLERFRGRMALVLEDFGGTSLGSHIGEGGLPIPQFLHVALALSAALGDIHRADVIHKDLKPDNFIVDRLLEKVRVTDFGIATRLPREAQRGIAADFAGTLAYMPPEQTGRTNRALDYRSDFYSLGASFYHMLTGRVPFRGNDALEMLYAHVATMPASPHDVRPEVPVALSEIVMRLMTKAPEDRYQSANGLAKDLERCRESWMREGTIVLFPLARDDASERFQLPERVYGRDAELSLLEGALATAAGGGAEVVMIAGSAGVGKSCLVQEMQRPILLHHGLFASGKFDQLRGDIPYAPVTEAVRELLRQVLAQPAEVIEDYRARIASVLGASAQLIVEAVPEVEYLASLATGRGALPALGPTETQHRYNLAFKTFLSVFAKEGQPLVLFFDDMQWADAASLKLIQTLVTDADAHHQLVIGSYRPEEVSESHPLTLMLKSVQGARVVRTIQVSELGEEAVTAYVRDCTRAPEEECRSLARTLREKTGGNPFFLGHFLVSLYAAGHIAFDGQRRCFTWDRDRIGTQEMTENVVTLLASKISGLPAATAEVVRLASCIGNRFDLQSLSAAAELSPLATTNALWPAVQAGLVIPLGDAWTFVTEDVQDTEDVVWRFAHDRVQQAAYDLLPERLRRAVHARIGRLLLLRSEAGGIEDRLFEIANHLNAGEPPVGPEACRQLAELDYRAGAKALRSIAYDAASRFLAAGIHVLPEAEHRGVLGRSLRQAYAQVLMISGRVDESEPIFDALILDAPDHVARAQCLDVRSEVLQCAGRSAEAYAMARRGLGMLGLAFPEGDTADTEAAARVAELLEPEALTRMRALPDGDERAILEGRLYDRAIISAYFSQPKDLSLVIGASVHHALRSGVTPQTSLAAAWFGVIAELGGHQAMSIDWAELAVALAGRYDDPYVKGRVDVLAWCMCLGWKYPLADAERSLSETYLLCHSTGDLQYASYALLCVYIASLVQGGDAAQTLELCKRWKDYCQKYVPLELGQAQIRVRCMDLLMGNPVGTLDEEAIIADYEAKQNYTDVCESLIELARIATLFGDSERAFDLARRAEPWMAAGAAGALLLNLLFYHHYGVACARLIARSDDETRPLYTEKLAVCLKKLAPWAARSPASFGGYEAMVLAEAARAEGKRDEGIALYIRTIEHAGEQGQVLLQATAAEHLASLLGSSQRGASLAFLKDARDMYAQYGARAKVLLLDEAILAQRPQDDRRSLEPVSLTGTSTSSETSRSGLDLVTVMKAAQAISGELELGKLLQRLVHIAVESAGAQRCVFVLVDGERMFVEAEGRPDREIRVLQSLALTSPEVEIPRSLVNYVARTKQAVVLSDAARTGAYVSDPYVEEHHPRSVMCVPLIHQARLTGILYLENNLAEDAFTKGRLELLKLLSAFIASAIVNAYLFTRLEEKVQERTQALTLALDHLRATQRQLVESEKLAALGGLVGGIAHEISTPVGIGVTGASHMEEATQRFGAMYTAGTMRRQDLDRYVATVRESSGLILANLHRASELIHSFKQVAVDQSSEEKRPFRMKEYLESILLHLKPRLKHTHHRTVVLCDDTLVVTSYPGAIAQIVTNLVMNSIIHAYEPDGEGLLTIAVTVVDGALRLDYSDDGRGIPEASLPRIFDPFFTTRRGDGGSGLGLHIVHNLVTQRLRGRINVESHVGAGTRFVIEVPLEGAHVS